MPTFNDSQNFHLVSSLPPIKTMAKPFSEGYPETMITNYSGFSTIESTKANTEDLLFGPEKRASLKI